MFTLQSKSQKMTGTLGKRIGASLSGGEVLALTGELGAGKTVFVKGLSIGLEIDDVITSPTYVLVKSYSGRLPLHHIDFYRLSGFGDLESIGFEDYLGGNGVLAMEWAEKFLEEIPLPFLHITIEYEEKGKRLIKFDYIGSTEKEEKLKKILKIT
jgi:tRNA threonylcarbamoyladenosine biosynthesis protein TsaE